jgi:hypothetical protein
MIPFAFFHILTILKTFFVDKKGQLLQAADLEIIKSISSSLNVSVEIFNLPG